MAAKRYAIEIHSGVSAAEMAEAEQGTVRDGRLVHPMNPERSGVEIKTIRGDYRDENGVNQNRLRPWEKSEFVPRPDDIFQERLYCIQWIAKEPLAEPARDIFRGVTDEDLARERKVEAIVRENLARWQEEGLVPDMLIEPGDKTDEPIRTRGWTYWHHLFAPRHTSLALYSKAVLKLTPRTVFLGVGCAITTANWHDGSLPRGNPTVGNKIGAKFLQSGSKTLLNYGVSGDIMELRIFAKIDRKTITGSGDSRASAAVEPRTCDIYYRPAVR